MKYYAPQHDLAERRFLQQNVDILPTEYGRLKRNLTTQNSEIMKLGFHYNQFLGDLSRWNLVLLSVDRI